MKVARYLTLPLVLGSILSACTPLTPHAVTAADLKVGNPNFSVIVAPVGGGTFTAPMTFPSTLSTGVEKSTDVTMTPNPYRIVLANVPNDSTPILRNGMITAITFSDPEFSLDAASTCAVSGVLTPSESSDGTSISPSTAYCDLVIDFIPTTTGVVTGTMTVTYSGPTGSFSTTPLQLSGTGSVPAVSVSLAAPSSLDINSTSVGDTIAVSFTNVTKLASANLNGTSTGITLTGATTGCSAVWSGLTTTGGTITITGCSGNGTITAHVDSGVCFDALLANVTSSESAVITVDNSGPTLLSLTPPSATVGTIPTAVVATFSKAVLTLSAGNFGVTGTCGNNPSVLPTVSGVVMSAGNTVATATLAGGNCLNTQTVIVSLNPTVVKDIAGNSGTGSIVSKTYTYSMLGPKVTLGAPASVLIQSASAGDVITVAFTGATSIAPNLNTTNTGITLTTTGTVAGCTYLWSGVTINGGNITISGCSGNGTITAHVNTGVCFDASNTNMVSSESSVITVDNTGPTLVSLTPASASVGAMTTTVVATFNKAVQTLTGANFAFSGTCGTQPSVSSVVMSAGNTVATVTLAAASCNNGQTSIVTLNPTTVTDTTGNSGTGTSVANTYTLSNAGPLVTLGVPSLPAIRSGSAAVTIAVTFASANSHTPTVSSNTQIILSGATAGCSAVWSIVSASHTGGTISITGCTGNGTMTVRVGPGVCSNAGGHSNAQSAESSVITVDNTGPTLLSLTPLSAMLGALPTVVATFNEPVQNLAPARFVITGCTSAPTVTVVMTSSTVATATLSGGNCSEMQNMVVTLDPTGVLDTVGNSGIAGTQVRTYTMSSTGPSVTLGAPSSLLIHVASAGDTIAATFTNASSFVPVNGSSTGITLTGATAGCSAVWSGLSNSGGTITITGCSRVGTAGLTVHVNANQTSDGYQGNVQSAESASITVTN